MFPPSVDELEKRLRNRGTETEETLATRLGNSVCEIERGMKENDETCLIGYRLVNKDLEHSSPAFVSLIEGLYKNELGL